MIPSSDSSFGALLKQLRKRAGMTQADLAAAVGYSIPFISNLELNQRLPDVQMVMQMFVPALGLQDDPHMTVHLIEQAAVARGERPPIFITQQRVIQVQVQAELEMRTVSLPALPTPLIGRSATVNQLANRLQGHSGRLLTLVGPPGAGKTTLALAVAAHLQLHYRDGTVFVALAAISEPTLMAATILAAAGGSDSSPKPPQTKLIEFLRRKTLLLVLDNLEQIGGAAPLIAELVSECPGLCILATSRERLHLRAEQRFKVPPLDLAPAIELFVQRAQAVDSDFRLTPHNQPTLEAICQRLDCLPLALELCAAEIDLLSPPQLLAQLQAHRLDLLVDGAHDLPLRQRTLRTAIGSSYALLNEDESSLLRSLGIFVGGCDWHAVAAIAADRVATSARSLHSTLHALVGKSLVRAETLPNGEQRFLLLETIREFVLEQVRTQGEEAWLRARHFAIYLQLFRIGDSHLRRTEAATWLVRLEPEQGNLRAALQWTLDEGHYVDAAWLIIAACWFWLCRGNRYELGRWLAQLLPHRHTLAADQRMVILQNLHGVAHTWEEFQPVDRWTNEMMQLLEVCPQKLLQAATWYWRAIYAADFSPAAWEQSIALARAAGEAPALGAKFCLVADRDFVLVSSLWEYANTLIERGEVAWAAPFVTESLEIFRRRENQYEIADGLGTLGILALLNGDLAQSHRHLHEAVTMLAAFNHQEMLGRWQALLGLVILYGGNVPGARDLLHKSLHLCNEMKSWYLLAPVYTYLADAALWESKLDEAEQWLRQGLAHHADPQQTSLYEVERLFVAARLATAQQQYPRAATLFGLADQMHSLVHYAIGGPIRSLADAALATVQAALEPAVFAEAFAAGRQMSLEEAITTILAPGHVGGMHETILR